MKIFIKNILEKYLMKTDNTLKLAMIAKAHSKKQNNIETDITDTVLINLLKNITNK
jgi:hypothetical protein